jgi:glycosyltransferase involved in cell wall biosynthesis
MSIFVSVASYRDKELVATIDSLISNADNPQELVIGIVDQNVRGKHVNFDHYSNVKKINIHAKDAKGAGYARKIAMEMYDGEDYYFQTDSHMRFIKGWDTRLKEMLLVAQKESNKDKVILSQFPAPYIRFTGGEINYPKGDKDFWDEPSWTSVVNTWVGVWAGKREKIEDKSKPHKTHTILAGLLFTIGEFVEEIPYDERICFMGEELCIAIRAYTRGWELYAPNEMVCWHYYKRLDSDKVWKDNTSTRNWSDLEMYSQRVQKDVLLAIEEGIFGIGDYNKYLEYQKMIGINFEDFYENEIQDKVNMGLLTQEIEFDDDFKIIEIAKTGYCISGIHSKCLIVDLCQCRCHGEES